MQRTDHEQLARGDPRQGGCSETEEQQLRAAAAARRAAVLLRLGAAINQRQASDAQRVARDRERTAVGAEDDLAGLAAFTAAAGERVQVVLDDAVVTSADRIRAHAAAGAGNTALIKPNQAGTLTETRAALEAARALLVEACAALASEA
jgi:hypothetical protein